MLPKGLLEQRLSESEVFPPKVYSYSFKPPRKRNSPHLPLTRIVGAFYESLGTALFGGVCGTNSEKPQEYPDIMDLQRGRFIESKAARHSGRVMLKDLQTAYHTQLQLSNKPIANPHLYVNFFRYGIREMCHTYEGRKSRELIEFLASNTRFLVGLDFSIVHRCYSLGFQNHKLLSRNYGKGTPATHFLSILLDLFFAQPEEALKRVGLSAKDYRILFRKSAEEFKVNRLPIRQFPIVLIKSNENVHQRFIEELKKSN